MGIRADLNACGMRQLTLLELDALSADADPATLDPKAGGALEERAKATEPHSAT